ncbi:spirocyclase AveC family protein [Streptomyces sp. NPDC002276]
MTQAPPLRPANSAPAQSSWAWLRRPVGIWAMAGLLLLAFGVVAIARWIAAGQASFSLGTQYDVSTPRRVALWFGQGTIAASSAGLVVWAVRQYRREHRLTFDAQLIVAYTTTMWIGPVASIRTPNLVTNLAGMTTTSWAPFLLGHRKGTTPVPEGMWVGELAHTAGVFWLAGTALVMRLLFLRRQPRLRGVPLILATLLCATLADYVLEVFCVPLTGLYAHSVGVPALTLFSGHWYQLPLIEAAIVGIGWGGVPYLVRHYHVAHGPETSVLRGAGAVPPGIRTPVTLFALIGLLSVCILAVDLALTLNPQLFNSPHWTGPSPYPFGA